MNLALTLRVRRAVAVAAIGLVVASCTDEATPDATSARTDAPTPSTDSTAATTTATTVTDATTSTVPSADDSTTAPTSAPADTTPLTTATVAPAGDGSGAVIGDSILTLDEPVELTVRPGDASTFYFVERGGRVQAWVPGGEPREVLDATDLTDGGGERGLLGLAFAPDGAHAYVYYTHQDDGSIHIDEFAVGTDGAFDAASRRELLVVEHPYSNHNGGQLAVGPDGYLYAGLGDGGAAGDPDRRALDLGDLLGKILRIDPAGGDPYAVPPGNPFADTDGARPEVWSYGLRNPWRFSFDSATGDLWIGDVGQGAWEEIDVARADEAGLNAGAGLNFGWSALEGNHRFNDDQPDEGATPPVHEYSHGEGCSVTGGAVYRGSAIPGLFGWYVFADYCSGTVWAIDASDGADTTEAITIGQAADVSAVSVGPDNELFIVELSGDVRPVVAA